MSDNTIQEEKMLILVKLRKLTMTESNLLFLRENYSDLLMPFITKSIKLYTERVITEENFDLSEIVSLLSENIDDKYKIKLLELSTDEISLKRNNYSDTVKLHILDHNLDLNDIPYLISCYFDESIDVRNAIKDILIIHIDEIVSEQYPMPFKLLIELFAQEDIVEENKLELFTINIDEMNEAQVKEVLSILHMDDFLSLFNRKRPKFEVNKINEEILGVFRRNHWITKYEIDKKEPEFFRAYGRSI